MNKSSRLLITAAAVAGLYAGTLASRTYAADQKAGTPAKEDAKKGKHDCAGKNDCKGLGGCKTAKNDCKGKNACKGQGGCSTMDKKDEKKKDGKKSG
ncbi:MAG: hypothetical protein ACREH8_12810 [Opitutaceae bacterium]